MQFYVIFVRTYIIIIMRQTNVYNDNWINLRPFICRNAIRYFCFDWYTILKSNWIEIQTSKKMVKTVEK